MTNQLRLYPQASTTTRVRYLTRKERKKLLATFWIGIIVLVFVLGFSVQNVKILSFLGGTLIAFAALLPSYLWCSGKALGLPIFPLFALTYLWTYALQLLNNNKKVVKYLPESQFFASVTVAFFLILATIIWFQFVKSAPKPPKYYRALNSIKGEGVFWSILIISIVFNMASVGGWLTLLGGSASIYKALILGLYTLAIFVLAYRWGTGGLSRLKSLTFMVLLFIAIVTNAASLLLVGAMAMFLVATVAWIAGRGKVPWITIIIVITCFFLLHYGKGEMRSKYWFSSKQEQIVQPWEYPAWYAEWIDKSFKKVNEEVLKPATSHKATVETPLERSSLIQLLLMIQEKTPRDLPYLQGATYAVIPKLLVPRFLNPRKIASHETTYMLSIYYGLQSRKDTFTTTIAFGLLNEAYANFGLIGCAGFAIIVGVGYGKATRWSIQAPILSFRALFGIILIGFAFQSEFTSGVYVTALLQSTVSLCGINFLFMTSQSSKELTN